MLNNSSVINLEYVSMLKEPIITCMKYNGKLNYTGIIGIEKVSMLTKVSIITMMCFGMLSNASINDREYSLSFTHANRYLKQSSDHFPCRTNCF